MSTVVGMGSFGLVLLLSGSFIGQVPEITTLERQLTSEPSAALARAAAERGDAQRGALVFHQPSLTCTACHAIGGEGPDLGPDLAKLGKETSPSAIIESILYPTKAIRKGYETTTIATKDGRTLVGLLAEERPDAIVLRDVTLNGKTVAIPRAQIEERNGRGPSLMPAGLVNGLTSRQQFLDLVCYIREVALGGEPRARELRPDPSAIPPPPLPTYENDLDHAGLIAELDEKHRKRGEAIYTRVCANCHGTLTQPGSLPTAPRFAEVKLKNGGDPYSIYRTLTHGSGLMVSQNWMVPKQKYDVIHYLRETFLKERNPSQYAVVDHAYLAKLPKGASRGPDPRSVDPWTEMDYGPSLIGTYELGDGGANIAYKGIAVRVDPGPGGIAAGSAWAVYDQDTMRYAGTWTGRGFIDWNGISFNGRHQVHPRAVGKVRIENPSGPGWANPADGSFTDVRLLGRDGKPYGPLPREWLHYRGLYRHGDRVILSYDIGDAAILDSPTLEVEPAVDQPVFGRILNIGPSARELRLRIAPDADLDFAIHATGAAVLRYRAGFAELVIPRHEAPLRVKLLMTRKIEPGPLVAGQPEDLAPFLSGGPAQWPEALHTKTLAGPAAGPFAVDVLSHPEVNPWSCQMHFTGLDFFPGGTRMAVSTWDGDVWTVSGLDRPGGMLAWRRIASGLFQPLGLKIVGGRIHVGCRDQIAILHDLNGDGETDFYENFNNDHQVTEHFHEFAMDLQTDPDGNFYYAKAARHALPALVPQHGTLLKVSKDGRRTEILATGFRAPNGVLLNPDGTFFMTDQEGHWIPKNRINWVRPGRFYGNMFGYHDITDKSDQAMEPPVCWITNVFDRSPAEILRVEHPAWGALSGSLLNLSYGNGKVFVVPTERVGDQMQGGMAALPIPPFPTGLIRGRFHPGDGVLYLCGMVSWASSQTAPGGLYRVRPTGKPFDVPIGLHAGTRGLRIEFSGTLDAATASRPENYLVKIWGLKRTENYGSEHQNEHTLSVTAVRLSDDRRSVTLTIPNLAPTRGMEIRYEIKSAEGRAVTGAIHNSILALGAD